MTTKKKVLKSFGILCFLACLAFVTSFAYGCSKSSSISGKFTFKTTDAHATITAEINGAADATNPNKLEFNGTVKPTEEQLATWNKSLSFAKKSETFTYTVTITNDSARNAMLTSFKNTSVTGKVNQSISLKVNGEDATFESEKVYSVSPSGSVVLTLTFTDADEKGDVGSYGYEVNMVEEHIGSTVNGSIDFTADEYVSAKVSTKLDSATAVEKLTFAEAEATETLAESLTFANKADAMTYKVSIKNTNTRHAIAVTLAKKDIANAIVHTAKVNGEEVDFATSHTYSIAPNGTLELELTFAESQAAAYVKAFGYTVNLEEEYLASKVNGSVDFNSTDANATVSATITGATDNTSPNQLTFNGTEATGKYEKNLQFAKYSGEVLEGKTLTYKVTITNTALTYLNVTIANNSTIGTCGLKVNGTETTFANGAYLINSNNSLEFTLTFEESATEAYIGSYDVDITLSDVGIAAADAALISNISAEMSSKGVTSSTKTEDMFAKLKTANLTYDTMQTNEANTYLYWIKDTNALVYANASDEVLYTNSAVTPNAATQTWISLTGTIPTEDYTISGDATSAVVTVANAKQLYKLSLDLYKNPSSETYYNFNNIIDSLYVGTYTETNEQKIALHAKNGANAIGENLIKEIVLANDIDMRGIDLCFGNNGITGKGNGSGVKQRDALLSELTFNGNGKELTNIYATTADFYNGEYKTTALFSTNYGTLTFKDLTITNSLFGTPVCGDSAILVSTNEANSSWAKGILNIDNVVIDGCTVYGETKVGTIVARNSKGGLYITGDTQIKNTNVYTVSGEAGGVFGYMEETFKFVRNENLENIDESVIYDNVEITEGFTVENKEILVADSVNVQVIDYSDFTGVEDNGYVRIVDLNGLTEVKGIATSTDGLLDKKLCIKGKDEFTFNVGNGFITSWDIIEIEPTGKISKGILDVRGSTAKYGFLGNGLYSRGIMLKDSQGNDIKIMYDATDDDVDNPTEFRVTLRYGAYAVNDVEDLGKLWCDIYSNSTPATSNAYTAQIPTPAEGTYN